MPQTVFEIDVAHEPVTTTFTEGQVAVLDHKPDADEEILISLGYRQEFLRKFNVWSIFSLSFSVLSLLPSVAATLTFSLGYVGTGGALWGWIVASIWIQFVAISMAELCSSMPTAVLDPKTALIVREVCIMLLLCFLPLGGDHSPQYTHNEVGK